MSPSAPLIAFMKAFIWDFGLFQSKYQHDKFLHCFCIKLNEICAIHAASNELHLFQLSLSVDNKTKMNIRVLNVASDLSINRLEVTISQLVRF